MSDVIGEEKNYTTFFDKERNSIQLSIDLDRIGSPDQYNIAFSVADTVKSSSDTIELQDTSSWIPIPLPKFSFSVSSNSLTLRASESKNVTLHTKLSDTNLMATVSYYIANNPRSLMSTIYPWNALVQPNELFTSRLSIITPKNAIVGSYILPIYATLRFQPGPVFTSERTNGSSSLTSDTSYTINKTSYLTVNIMPPLSVEEKIREFWVNSINSTGVWITQANQFFALLAAIGVSGAGIIGWLLKKLRTAEYGKNHKKYRREDDEWK
jgi:hypothetical protein